jgi:hypothetical protein
MWSMKLEPDDWIFDLCNMDVGTPPESGHFWAAYARWFLEDGCGYMAKCGMDAARRESFMQAVTAALTRTCSERKWCWREAIMMFAASPIKNDLLAAMSAMLAKWPHKRKHFRILCAQQGLAAPMPPRISSEESNVITA